MAIGQQGKARPWGLVVAVAGVALSLTAAAHAAFPAANGRIAFTYTEIGLRELPPGEPPPPKYGPAPLASRIETILPSGRGRRVLSTCPPDSGPCFYHAPAWSPGGETLAFLSHWRGESGPPWQHIALLRSDGTGFQRLQLPAPTDPGGFVSWSPDGDRLAFHSPVQLGGLEAIYTVRSDGTDLRKIADGFRPAWSPAGRIAFMALDGSGYTQIYTVEPDGSGRRQVTRGRRGKWDLEWSPHGTKLAYVTSDIYIIGADGRGRRRLTYRGGRSPAWSPDGKWIAFSREGDIYVVRSNGRGLRRLIDACFVPDEQTGFYADEPSWQAVPRARRP
jgi:dipeptidyl aminopeptidase/acylaminoacyl peptidase